MSASSSEQLLPHYQERRPAKRLLLGDVERHSLPYQLTTSPFARVWSHVRNCQDIFTLAKSHYGLFSESLRSALFSLQNGGSVTPSGKACKLPPQVYSAKLLLAWPVVVSVAALD
ncbi:hypothetical protein PI125_g5100 [Phytophthora idaei]|nr:hypothetical protein PI125_g5100 [Phytophthora idaei]KAG3165241.1 hypothetical protein PI126_g4724 [Phytophthora idaei]